MVAGPIPNSRPALIGYAEVNDFERILCNVLRMDRAAPWRRDATTGQDSPYRHAAAPAEAVPRYHTLTYEVDGRIARLTFDRTRA